MSECKPEGTAHAVPLAFVPQSHPAAAQGLVDFPVVQSIKYKNRCLAAPLDGADALILDFARSLLKDCRSRGWPMFAHQYLRGQKEQNNLFAAGYTRARWGQSPHNFGMAVDIVHYGKYWNLTPKEWAVIGMLGKEVARRRNIKITWGGDWKFYDPAHWELADWKKRRDNR